MIPKQSETLAGLWEVKTTVPSSDRPESFGFDVISFRTKVANVIMVLW